jgi:hypothetical protein
VVSMTPQKSFQRCQWHHRNLTHNCHSHFCTVNGTAETVSAMLMTPCFSGVTVTTEI